MPYRVLYLSENAIVTAQNPPVFSIIVFHVLPKRTNFEDNYLADH